MHESDGEMGYEASVLMKNGRNPTKGKNNQVICEKNIEGPSDGSPNKGDCYLKIGVSYGYNDMRKS